MGTGVRAAISGSGNACQQAPCPLPGADGNRSPGGRQVRWRQRGGSDAMRGCRRQGRSRLRRRLPHSPDQFFGGLFPRPGPDGFSLRLGQFGLLGSAQMRFVMTKSVLSMS